MPRDMGIPPGEYAVVGGEVSRVIVTLRIMGDALDVAQVNARLAVTPTRVTSGVRGTVWTFTREEQEHTSLADAIVAMLARLPNDATVWQWLAARYSLEIWCGLFLDGLNQGAELPAQLLNDIGGRHIAMVLDIYSPPTK